MAVFSSRSGRGPERIVLSARLRGARPRTRYEFMATDYGSSSGAVQSWASGTSDARGTVRLTGRSRTVDSDSYALWLDPSPLRSGPGLHGYLTAVGGLSAIRNGYDVCAP